MTIVTDRTGITRELDNLINQQISTFKQDAEISDAELTGYRERSQRIRVLCQSLHPGSSGPRTANDVAESGDHVQKSALCTVAASPILT